MGQHRARARPPKIVGAISLAIWVLANTVVWYHYAGTRPRDPNPRRGNIYPLNTHGSVVYLTVTDCIVLCGALAAGFISTGSVILLSLRRNVWTLPGGRTT